MRRNVTAFATTIVPVPIHAHLPVPELTCRLSIPHGQSQYCRGRAMKNRSSAVVLLLVCVVVDGQPQPGEKVPDEMSSQVVGDWLSAFDEDQDEHLDWDEVERMMAASRGPKGTTSHHPDAPMPALGDANNEGGPSRVNMEVTMKVPCGSIEARMPLAFCFTCC